MDQSVLEYIGLDTTNLELLRELFIVIAIGLLIGVEREFSRLKNTTEPKSFAGIRTFTIVAILGYLSALLSQEISVWILVVAAAGVFFLVGLSYFFTAKLGSLGGTSEFALIICFYLGIAVFYNYYHFSVATAVVLTLILAFKGDIHTAVRKLSKKDVLSIVQFVVITALVLPLLPNKDFGPFGIFNLYKIWLIVAIFVSLNFIAYFLTKFIDQDKSLLATGVLGGFVSSTATAWFFSRRSKQSTENPKLLAAAIVLASSIMFPRMLVWLAILNNSFFYRMLIPLLLLGSLGMVIGYFLAKRNTIIEDQQPGNISNPINLKDAIIFAVIYVLILWLVEYARSEFGAQGVFIASALAGLTDIDAITISMAGYGKENIDLLIPSIAIMIAAMCNTLVKYIFCLAFGSKELKRYCSYAFIPLFTLGVIIVSIMIMR